MGPGNPALPPGYWCTWEVRKSTLQIKKRRVAKGHPENALQRTIVQLREDVYQTDFIPTRINAA
jgi:hypothetical protein